MKKLILILTSIIIPLTFLSACKEEVKPAPEPPKVPELKTVDYWLADRENMMHFRTKNCGSSNTQEPDDCGVIHFIVYDRKNDNYARARQEYERILRIRAKDTAQ